MYCRLGKLVFMLIYVAINTVLFIEAARRAHKGVVAACADPSTCMHTVRRASPAPRALPRTLARHCPPPCL